MLLFGAGSKGKSVRGGAQVERFCEECRVTRTFVEFEFEDKVELFFVPVLEGKTRRLVCTECMEDVELESKALPPKKKEDPPRRAFSEREKDDLLAALKKKMGKSI